MEISLSQFQNVQVLLTHGEQNGNILLPHHMPFPETWAFINARDDLRHVMTQDMADCLLCIDQSHHFAHFAASSFCLFTQAFDQLRGNADGDLGRGLRPDLKTYR